MGSETLSQDSLRAAVRAAGVEVPPHYHEAIPSTNAEVAALAGSGAPAWTVVAAGHQTEGRGRLGRRWVEAPGKALLMSVLLRPAIAPEDAPLLTLLAATAMSDACRELSGTPVGCKWPNDLVVGERKVGGILAEARVEDDAVAHVVMGTGVNVDMQAGDFPEDLRRTATSLAVEGQIVHPALLVRGYLERLREGLRPEAPGFASGVIEAYRERCVSLRRVVRATTTAGTEVEGLAADLDERGGLVIESEEGGHVVAFGEIAHLDVGVDGRGAREGG